MALLAFLETLNFEILYTVMWKLQKQCVEKRENLSHRKKIVKLTLCKITFLLKMLLSRNFAKKARERIPTISTLL